MSPSLSLARSHTMRAHTDMYRHLYMPVVCGYRSCTMRTFHVVLSMHLEMGFGIVLKRSCTLERFHIMEEKRIVVDFHQRGELCRRRKKQPKFPHGEISRRGNKSVKHDDNYGNLSLSLSLSLSLPPPTPTVGSYGRRSLSSIC